MNFPVHRIIAGCAAAALWLGIAGAPAAQASQLDFTLENQSGRPIVLVYLSPATIRSWGDDVLGRPQLPNGESARLSVGSSTPHAPCAWDIKFVYGSGTSAVRRYNLCSDPVVVAR
jgi:hypothetical protein